MCGFPAERTCAVVDVHYFDHLSTMSASGQMHRGKSYNEVYIVCCCPSKAFQGKPHPPVYFNMVCTHTRARFQYGVQEWGTYEGRLRETGLVSDREAAMKHMEVR